MQRVAEPLDALVLQLGVEVRVAKDADLHRPVDIRVGRRNKVRQVGTDDRRGVVAVPLEGKGAALQQRERRPKGLFAVLELDALELLDVVEKHANAGAELRWHHVARRTLGCLVDEAMVIRLDIKDGGQKERSEHLHNAVDERLARQDGDVQQDLHQVPVHLACCRPHHYYALNPLLQLVHCDAELRERALDRRVPKVGKGEAHRAPRQRERRARCVRNRPKHIGLNARLGRQTVQVPSAERELDFGGAEHLGRRPVLDRLALRQQIQRHRRYSRGAHFAHQLHKGALVHDNVILDRVVQVQPRDKQDAMRASGVGLVQGGS